MPTLPLYQLDAFATQVFLGNPAAVCPLETWLPDETMARIAAENNLSETAFFVPEGGRFSLRWFTPTIEVDLCGHATLASAWVIFHELRPELSSVAFETKSGTLGVRRKGELLELDLPTREGRPSDPPPGLVEGLGSAPVEVLDAPYWLAVYEREADIAALAPDMQRLAMLGRAVIASAPGDAVDFVSRFFAPSYGVPEDPVTGSSHCTLAPYWAKRLGKRVLSARQISRRGGELSCEHAGSRTKLAGRCALYLEGRIHV
jgi:predicted PhzF superfamily epimerase YddE/YHI9